MLWLVMRELARLVTIGIAAGAEAVRQFPVCVACRHIWSSASDQNEEQKYSLKNYLEHNGVGAPHIGNLIWLRNLLNKDLPPRPHNMRRPVTPRSWKTASLRPS